MGNTQWANGLSSRPNSGTVPDPFYLAALPYKTLLPAYILLMAAMLLQKFQKQQNLPLLLWVSLVIVPDRNWLTSCKGETVPSAC